MKKKTKQNKNNEGGLGESHTLITQYLTMRCEEEEEEARRLVTKGSLLALTTNPLQTSTLNRLSI